MVVNGAGAASIACVELIKRMGLPHDQAILCDTKGVIYQGRTEGMNQWKSGARGGDQGAHPGRGDGRAPTCSSACPPRARSPRTW